MGKHVYRAKVSMAGVTVGDLFEAEDGDPRVLSGLVELVKRADVPAEVKQALAEASEGDEASTEAAKPKKG